jgi:spermidine synthase
MKPHERLADVTAPDGTHLVLVRHDGDYYLRANGVELMSTRRSHSEEELATIACGPIADRRGARVLVGGLGFGFTLRCALQVLAPDATVVVAELLRPVIDWNLEPTWGLGHDALADPRVTIKHADVRDVLRSQRGAFDAILMDVDNGAEAFTTAGNAALYTDLGIATAVAALRPAGRLAYWSATEDPPFTRALRRAGLTVETIRSRIHARARSAHVILLATQTAKQ